MQNLRDKLMKAGAVSKKAARKARTEVRRQRKGHDAQGDANNTDQQKREAFAARQAAETAASRARELARQRDKEAQAEEDRLRQIIEQHRVVKDRGHDRPFHFVSVAGRIRRIHLNFDVAEDLGVGRLGIVLAPYDSRRNHRIVPVVALTRLAELAPQRILFWNRSEGPDDLPTYGAVAPGPTQDPRST